MEQKVQKLLRKKLAHLDDAEQDTAARYLILAGLKHYSLLYAGQDVHIPILEFLGGKKFGHTKLNLVTHVSRFHCYCFENSQIC